MTEKKNSGELVIGDYIVCLIKVLGAKERIENLEAASQKSPDDFMQAVKGSVGVILPLKELFISFFSKHLSLARADIKQTLPEYLKHFQSLKRMPVHAQQFSDTFVFYTPLRNKKGEVSYSSIYGMLIAASASMTASLSHRHSIRASIDIDCGIELDENNFYGPVLTEVARLEKEVAIYPRIVVSKDAHAFIKKTLRCTKKDFGKKFNNAIRKKCSSVLCKDTDGEIILDYLGKDMLSVFPNKKALDAKTKIAFKYACDEYNRFKKESNKKFTERYKHLISYMTLRLAKNKEK